MSRLAAQVRSVPRAAAKATKPAIRRVWRQVVLQRAIDETAASAVRTAVVVAPHPDDETLGCGAVIARKRAQGTDVVVVVVTDGRHSHRSQVLSPDRLAQVRAEEVRAACATLGVHPSCLHLLGFEEASLGHRVEAVAERLLRIIQEVRPDDVLTTCGADWHVDHQAVSVATRAAVAASGCRPRLLEYPIWWWVDGPWPTGSRLRPWRYVADPLRASRARAVTVRTEAFLATKRAALLEYRSQTTNLTGESTWAVMDDDMLALFLGPVEPFLTTRHGPLA